MRDARDAYAFTHVKWKKKAVGRSQRWRRCKGRGPPNIKLKRLSDGPHEISLRTERLSEKGDLAIVDLSNVSRRDLVLVFFFREICRSHRDAEEAADFDDRVRRPNHRAEHQRMPRARQHSLRAENPVQNR